ncbi:30S ribosomal protein S17 [Patescibacteria group bacterium]|nr:30S ribosomal protein S17 [Patescibacteria group bacterium]
MEKKVNKTIPQGEDIKKKSIRQLVGTVASAKMQKTVVVAVDKLKLNKKYRKQYKVTKKYKAHDEKGEYKAGDKVIIQETHPMSKGKRWTVMGKVK